MNYRKAARALLLTYAIGWLAVSVFAGYLILDVLT